MAKDRVDMELVISAARDESRGRKNYFSKRDGYFVLRHGQLDGFEGHFARLQVVLIISGVQTSSIFCGHFILRDAGLGDEITVR